ncbi:Aldehyde/histidinol dehydrogenase [Aspergillus pseudonomiae]|uniref:aldehyde dehydrogenase (NAD(+)) n=1 Tax=Aspergillus pseudonomiae TaxID=1506151 RepID=A0A5N6ICW2_9EURO|nr:Aldehyde/histidinol dehydrogenase [Aspergillus pseudonomiae]KAB8263620.1 Aldehyde/histidinol dehydrogenase [Aspergillus pseudonomiae]KAE8408484.1 Aldehyde/histidinol dehydrogenase [Aspergillus pseudonomiae]
MTLDITTFYNVINNELTTTAETRHGINPANQQPNPEVPVSTAADLDKAVNAARQAFKTWSQTSIDERRQALSAFADAIEENKDTLARLLTQEQGKPLNQAAGEIDNAVIWARAIPQLEVPEKVIEDNEQHKVVQRHIPIGVGGAIVPWNFPVMLAVGKIIPAVYTGNTIIVKPSPFTPYCNLKLGELAARCFPPGVVQVLSGGDDLGPMITEHPGIDKISFTGSSLTGRRVMASCAKTLKRVTLELGGNDPAIVCDDVDIDAIIPKVGILSFLCSSQICMMIKRLYVHEKIYDEFRDKLVAFVKNLKLGEGTEPDVFFGPLQNSMQFGKARNLIEHIASEGLNSVLGGDIPESKGFFVPPTIVDNPPDNSRIVQEEPFAPILPILKWSDEKDVIARANDTELGLGASVWTKDAERGQRIARQLEAGNVWVNTHFMVLPNVPFGGHKSSGIGSEWGVTGLTGWCNTQALYFVKNA